MSCLTAIKPTHQTMYIDLYHQFYSMEEIVLPQILTKSKINLSPFTWNNLKIPPIKHNHQRVKSFSQKKTKPIQKHNESIHLKTIKELPKEQKDQRDKHKTKKEESKQNYDNQRLSMHTAVTQSIKPRMDTQNIRQRSKFQKINKTIQIIKSQQAKADGQVKRIRFLDDRNNMERYLKNNLQRIGWSESTKYTDNQANLLWSNIDKLGDHHKLKEGQYYNHINGSFSLTNKDKLHQNMAGKSYYPTSFLIPKQYGEFAQHNNHIAVKRMLKVLAMQIQQFINPQSSQSLMQVTLSQILQSSIIKLGNQDTSALVKMCIYLEEIRRKQKHLSYFQKFKNYKHINLTPKQHFYDQLIQKSFAYLQGSKLQYFRINYKDIDYRLLVLILHYHQLFIQFDQTYSEEMFVWIVKPIASSRGAGISLVKAGKEFCINPQNMWNQFKNRKKYQNKIVQQYITNPYLLMKTPNFARRKFDIRQWVLVTAFKNKPIIYKYHTAYCRFSHELYTTNKLNKEIHLTNYSIFKTIEENSQIPSIMMLEDLFGEALGDLRSKYNQQVNQIITDCILSCSQIKYQDGCFELFGFDFLIDSAQKVYLLQVNLNPACNAQRHPKLQQQSDIMTKTMISLVTESKPTDKWIKLYGPTNNIDSCSEINAKIEGGEQELQIKPYYSYQLTDDESLIALVRYKGRVVSRMFDLCQIYQWRRLLSLVKKEKWEQQQQQVNLKEMIHFIEQKSVSNF